MIMLHPFVPETMDRLRQYLRLLAGQAAVLGVELEAAGSPLVQ